MATRFIQNYVNKLLNEDMAYAETARQIQNNNPGMSAEQALSLAMAGRGPNTYLSGTRSDRNRTSDGGAGYEYDVDVDQDAYDYINKGKADHRETPILTPDEEDDLRRRGGEDAVRGGDRAGYNKRREPESVKTRETHGHESEAEMRERLRREQERLEKEIADELSDSDSSGKPPKDEVADEVADRLGIDWIDDDKDSGSGSGSGRPGIIGGFPNIGGIDPKPGGPPWGQSPWPGDPEPKPEPDDGGDGGDWKPFKPKEVEHVFTPKDRYSFGSENTGFAKYMSAWQDAINQGERFSGTYDDMKKAEKKTKEKEVDITSPDPVGAAGGDIRVVTPDAPDPFGDAGKKDDDDTKTQSPTDLQKAVVDDVTRAIQARTRRN